MISKSEVRPKPKGRMMKKRLDNENKKLDHVLREVLGPINGNSKQDRVSDEFTGEQNELIEKHRAEIAGCWHKAKKDIIKVAKACDYADWWLDDPEKAELVKRLRFSRPTFVKLVQIANDPRIV